MIVVQSARPLVIGLSLSVKEMAIGACVKQALHAMELADFSGNVLVVDNGSGDRSAEVAREAGVTVNVYPRQGDPADAILDVAEEREADLIVVGNKGMTGAKRFLLGSVPNKVSHHAPCSVLIIRTV